MAPPPQSSITQQATDLLREAGALPLAEDTRPLSKADQLGRERTQRAGHRARQLARQCLETIHAPVQGGEYLVGDFADGAGLLGLAHKAEDLGQEQLGKGAAAALLVEYEGFPNLGQVLSGGG